MLTHYDGGFTGVCDASSWRSRNNCRHLCFSSKVCFLCFFSTHRGDTTPHYPSWRWPLLSLSKCTIKFLGEIIPLRCATYMSQQLCVSLKTPSVETRANINSVPLCCCRQQEQHLNFTLLITVRDDWWTLPFWKDYRKITVTEMNLQNLKCAACVCHYFITNRPSLVSGWSGFCLSKLK